MEKHSADLPVTQQQITQPLLSNAIRPPPHALKTCFSMAADLLLLARVGYQCGGF